MKNPTILITLIFIILHLTLSTLAWDELMLRTFNCSIPATDNTKSSSPSSYESNLNLTLSSILSNTNPINTFYNISSGQDPNKASAITLCRGDVNHTSCHACLADIVKSLHGNCSNYKEAIGWEDECMLRYSNRSIFGLMETSPTFGMCAPHNLSENDVMPFKNKRDKLLGKLQNKAISRNPPSYFETGYDSVSDNLKVYGMVQCTPDISTSLCSQCLDLAIQNILSVCSGNTKGARVLMPSCNIRFEVDPFYFDSILMPPKVAPALAPEAKSSVKPTFSPMAPSSSSPASSAMRGWGTPIQKS